MSRVAFLVDGFNVYHAVREANADHHKTLKWLDLHAVCRSYLSVFGRDAVLERVMYFSAYATFLTPKDPGVAVRHKTYVNALRATGVTDVMGRFKWKPRWCSNCQRQVPGHEEKETDVAIAVELMRSFSTDTCDIAVLMTGDTDLLPAVNAARQLHPEKQVWVVFPYKRANLELKQAADGSMKLGLRKLEAHQLPNPITALDGTDIWKPIGW